MRVGLVAWVVVLAFSFIALGQPVEQKTVVSIEGDAFHINGKPTYAGRTWKGQKVEGLLMNARLVQGIFDDLNAETRDLWKYPDGSAFDAERNTREFVAAMPEWRRHGLISFTINFQGGSPQGYSSKQPWHNSAFREDGSLRPEYLGRLERILDKADELGMAPMVGFFYFGQEHRFTDEAAMIRALDGATDWLLAKGYRNVLIEIANETNHSGYRAVLKPDKTHVLIERVKERSKGKVKSPAGRLLVSTSLTGAQVPTDGMAKVCDYLLLHGNGVGQPAKIAEMVDRTRKLPSYRGQPVLFNEDDHFDFDKAENNFAAAVAKYAGWGCFDYRMKDEGFDEGYQSVPVNWGISSERKRGFFRLLKEITGE